MFSQRTTFVEDYFSETNIRYLQDRINMEFVNTYNQKVFVPDEFLVPVMRAIIEHRPDRMDQNGQRTSGLESLNEAVIHAVYTDISNEWEQDAKFKKLDPERDNDPAHTGVLQYSQIKTRLRKLNPSFHMNY